MLNVSPFTSQIMHKSIIQELSQMEPWEYFSDVLSIFFNTENILQKKYAKKPDNVRERLRYDLYLHLLQQLRELPLTAQDKADIIKILHDERILQAAQSAPLGTQSPHPTPVQTQWTPRRPISRLPVGEIIHYLNGLEPDKALRDVLAIFFDTATFLDEDVANPPNNLSEQPYQNLLKQLRKQSLSNEEKASEIQNFNDCLIHQAAKTPRLDTTRIIADLKTANRSLQHQVQQHKIQTAIATTQWHNEVETLTTQLAVERGQFKKELEQSRQEAHAKLQSVTEASQAEIKGLGGKIEELSQHVHWLETQKSEQQTQYAAILKEKHRLAQQWEETKTTQIQEKAELTSEKNNAWAENQLLKQQISTLEAQYLASERQKRELLNKLNEIKTTTAKEQTNLVSEKEIALVESQLLKEQLSQVTAQYHTSEREKLALRHELQDIKTATAKNQAAFASEKESACADVQRLKQQISEFEAKYHALEHEKQGLRELNHILDQEIHLAEDALKQADRDRNRLTVELNQQQILASDTSQLLMQIGRSISTQSIGTAYALFPNQFAHLLFAAISTDKKNYAAWDHLAELYLKFNHKNGLEAVIKDFEQTFSQGLDNTQHMWLQKWKNLLTTQALVEWTSTSALIENERQRTADEHIGEGPTDSRKRHKSSGSFSRPANATPSSSLFFPEPNPGDSSPTPPHSRARTTPQTGQVNSPSTVRFNHSSPSS